MSFCQATPVQGWALLLAFGMTSWWCLGCRGKSLNHSIFYRKKIRKSPENSLLSSLKTLDFVVFFSSENTHRSGHLLRSSHVNSSRPWCHLCLESSGNNVASLKPWPISRYPWCGSLTSSLEIATNRAASVETNQLFTYCPDVKMFGASGVNVEGFWFSRFWCARFFIYRVLF